MLIPAYVPEDDDQMMTFLFEILTP